MKKTSTLARLIVILILLSLFIGGLNGIINKNDFDSLGGNKDTTSTKKPAETTKPPVVIEPPVATQYAPEDYYALYVQDGLVMHLNFSEANENSDAILGGVAYEDTTLSAMDRFTGGYDSFLPYLVVVPEEANAIYGGTAKITLPWYFEDMYKDGYILGGGFPTGKAIDMRTEVPEDYIDIRIVDGQNVYVCKSFGYTTDYYFSNTTWARPVYTSTWGEGYMNIGAGGAVYIAKNEFFKRITKGSYTVDFTLRMDGTQADLYIGGRFVLDQSGGIVRSRYNDNGGICIVAGSVDPIMFENASDTEANHFTYTFDTEKRDSAGIVALGTYSNGAVAQFGEYPAGINKDQSHFSLGQARNNVALYAARIYDRALTAEEVLQNNFAEIALYGKLDITAFLALDDAAKLEVYKAFESYTVDTDAELLQIVLDSVAN